MRQKVNTSDLIKKLSSKTEQERIKTAKEDTDRILQEIQESRQVSHEKTKECFTV